MISFIIPAWNEEALIGATVEALHAAAIAAGRPYEIIVVNDDSSDRTAEIAQSAGARVITVQKRQIAAVRNAGAREAQGDILIFVDADTILPEPTLCRALQALDDGAVGGGCIPRMAESIPLLSRIYLWMFLAVWIPLGYAAGCFIFVRRPHFEAVGGFDELYFASEEVWLSKALKQRGRFVILRDPVWTSARKMRFHTPTQMFAMGIRLLWQGPKSWQKREGLDLWYDGRREEPSTPQ
jgi:GT2 family glycosyltransferase